MIKSKHGQNEKKKGNPKQIHVNNLLLKMFKNSSISRKIAKSYDHLRGITLFLFESPQFLHNRRRP